MIIESSEVFSIERKRLSHEPYMMEPAKGSAPSNVEDVSGFLDLGSSGVMAGSQRASHASIASLISDCNFGF